MAGTGATWDQYGNQPRIQAPPPRKDEVAEAIEILKRAGAFAGAAPRAFVGIPNPIRPPLPGQENPERFAGSPPGMDGPPGSDRAPGAFAPRYATGGGIPGPALGAVVPNPIQPPLPGQENPERFAGSAPGMGGPPGSDRAPGAFAPRYATGGEIPEPALGIAVPDPVRPPEGVSAAEVFGPTVEAANWAGNAMFSPIQAGANVAEQFMSDGSDESTAGGAPGDVSDRSPIGAYTAGFSEVAARLTQNMPPEVREAVANGSVDPGDVMKVLDTANVAVAEIVADPRAALESQGVDVSATVDDLIKGYKGDTKRRDQLMKMTKDEQAEFLIDLGFNMMAAGGRPGAGAAGVLGVLGEAGRITLDGHRRKRSARDKTLREAMKLEAQVALSREERAATERRDAAKNALTVSENAKNRAVDMARIGASGPQDSKDIAMIKRRTAMLQRKYASELAAGTMTVNDIEMQAYEEQMNRGTGRGGNTPADRAQDIIDAITKDPNAYYADQQAYKKANNIPEDEDLRYYQLSDMAQGMTGVPASAPGGELREVGAKSRERQLLAQTREAGGPGLTPAQAEELNVLRGN